MATRGVNKVILIGNLGADPDVRYMASGDPVANIRLATGDVWKDRNTGEQKERTEWHRVVFFGKLAGVVEQYLRKGSKLYVEGRLQTRQWTDQNGQDRYTTEVVVDQSGTMLMLDGRGSGTADFPDRAPTPVPPMPSDGTGDGPMVSRKEQDTGMRDDFADDVPF